jgi:hypothetical protein
VSIKVIQIPVDLLAKATLQLDHSQTLFMLKQLSVYARHIIEAKAHKLHIVAQIAPHLVVHIVRNHVRRHVPHSIIAHVQIDKSIRPLVSQVLDPLQTHPFQLKTPERAFIVLVVLAQVDPIPAYIQLD